MPHWQRPRYALINSQRAAMAELESVESVLEAAEQRALTEHELTELKRILYGKPALYDVITLLDHQCSGHEMYMTPSPLPISPPQVAGHPVRGAEVG